MNSVFPRIKALPRQRTAVTAFAGYDRRPAPREGGLAQMRNLSTDEYPFLVTRRPRGRVRALVRPHGLFALNGLLVADGTVLCHDGVPVDGLTLTDTDKRFAALGAKLVIFPDAVVYDTLSREWEKLARENVAPTNTSVRVSTRDGGVYGNVTVAAGPPESPENGDLWLDTSGEEHVMKLFSSLYGTWQSMAVSYVRIAAEGIGEGLRVGDAVDIEGFMDASLNGTKVIAARGDDWLVVPGLVDAAFDETATVRVTRRVPALDHITVCNNRLWGTCNAEHALYASAPGDPTNFYRYRGIADDAYAVTVGSPGPFTGIAEYGGTVAAFKADRIARVSGGTPVRFRLTETVCRGLCPGGGTAVVDNTLFYTAGDALMAFTAGRPVSVSQALGALHMERAALGAFGKKLYLSVTETDGKASLLVFDTETGLFAREDGTAAQGFAAWDGDLFFTAGNTLFSVNGSLPENVADADAALEGSIGFLAETGDLFRDLPDGGAVSKLSFRCEADEGALLRAELICDGGSPREIGRLTAGMRVCQTAYVLPRHCSSARLRFSGTGRVRLGALTITTERRE